MMIPARQAWKSSCFTPDWRHWPVTPCWTCSCESSSSYSAGIGSVPSGRSRATAISSTFDTLTCESSRRSRRATTVWPATASDVIWTPPRPGGCSAELPSESSAPVSGRRHPEQGGDGSALLPAVGIPDRLFFHRNSLGHNAFGTTVFADPVGSAGAGTDPRVVPALHRYRQRRGDDVVDVHRSGVHLARQRYPLVLVSRPDAARQP